MMELYNAEKYDEAMIELNRNGSDFYSVFNPFTMAKAFSARIDGGKDYAMSISGDGVTHIAIDCDGYTWIVDPNAWAAGENATAVATDGFEMAVLYKNGKVNSESMYDAELDTSDWNNVKCINVGRESVFGVTKDGKLLMTGDYGNDGYYSENYKNVEQILVSDYKIAILHKDGRLEDEYGQELFEGVVCGAIANNSIWGINKQGKLIGSNLIINDKKDDYNKWTNLVWIDGSDDYLVGLKKDGTMIYKKFDEDYGEIEEITQWNNIISFAMGDTFIMGLKQDGTIIVAGGRPNDMYEITDYNLFTGEKMLNN